jgi:hypothetical protein
MTDLPGQVFLEMAREGQQGACTSISLWDCKCFLLPANLILWNQRESVSLWGLCLRQGQHRRNQEAFAGGYRWRGLYSKKRSKRMVIIGRSGCSISVSPRDSMPDRPVRICHSRSDMSSEQPEPPLFGVNMGGLGPSEKKRS